MSPEETWASYGPGLKNYIMKRVADKYEAEDLHQEVFVRLQKNALKLTEIQNIKAWLYRITHHLIADYYRGRNKYRFEAINELSEEASISGQDSYKTDQDNYNKETAECLLKMLDYLPAKDKEALLESDYKGKKQSVLGKKWGLSNSGSKARVQRARRKLKAVLLNCCEVKTDNAGNIIDFHNKAEAGAEFRASTVNSFSVLKI